MVVVHSLQVLFAVSEASGQSLNGYIQTILEWWATATKIDLLPVLEVGSGWTNSVEVCLPFSCEGSRGCNSLNVLLFQ